MPAARDTEVGAELPAGALGKRIQHVDDPAPIALLHARPDQPAETDRREQIQVEVLLPGLVADVLERHRSRGSGIVDEHVDPAQISDDQVVGLDDVGGLGYVTDVVAHHEPIPGECLACRLEVSCPAREYGYSRPRLGKPARHGDADALAGAGHNGNTVLHRQVHGCSSLIVVRNNVAKRTRDQQGRAGQMRHEPVHDTASC